MAIPHTFAGQESPVNADKLDANNVYLFGLIRYAAVTADGALGDGTTDDRAAFAAAAVAHPLGVSVPAPGTYRISSNLTINAPLSIAPGALLSIDTGVTLTLNGPIIAGNYQIFTGVGTAAGNPIINEVNALWFGVLMDGNVSTNGGTNNSAALTKAVAFALNATNRKPVKIPGGGGHCKLVTRVDAPSGVKVCGDGPYSTLVFAATGFNDPEGLLRTVESGAGQPPGGIFDMCILAAAGMGASSVGVNLEANASEANNLWIGSFILAHLRHASTSQRSERIVIDQGGSSASVGILIEAPGCQVISPHIYGQQNGIVIQNLPTNMGKIPVQVTGAMVISPVGAGTGCLVSATNGMPVELDDCGSYSDDGTGYAAGAFRFTNSATNVRATNCRAEFGSAATGAGTEQTGFWIDGSSEVELHSPRTKRCRYGVLLQSNNNRVFKQNHWNTVVDGCNFAAGVSGNLIDGGYINGSGGNGVTLVNTALSNFINNLLAIGCTGYGVSIAQMAGQYNTVKGNQAILNTAGAYQRTGTTANIIWSGNSDATAIVA